MNAIKKIRHVSEILSSHGIGSADKEAQLIVKHSLAVDLADIYRDNPEVNNEKETEIDGMVSRRVQREPLQYILGHIDFLGMRIKLGREVLIPRPETEMMVEYAVKVISSQLSVVSKKIHTPTADHPRSMILDLCTGSGCIALALAKEFPGSLVYGVDVSKDAIVYAGENALENNVDNAAFICGNIFEALESHQKFDMIIANPPYIPSSDMQNLAPEIREWEPRTALDGGTDGLDAYRAIIPRAGNFLKNSGILIVELGISLAHAVSVMAEDAGFSGIAITKDLAGIERILRAEWTR